MDSSRFSSKRIILVLLVVLTPFFFVMIPEAIRFGLLNWMLYEYVLIRMKMWLWSYFIFLLVLLALLLLTNSLAISSGILLFLSLIIGIANLNTLTYRSMPFMPNEVFMAKDAAIAVQSGFHIIFGKSVWILISFVVAYILLTHYYWKPIKLSLLKRLIACTASLLGVFLLVRLVVYNETLMTKLGHKDKTNMSDLFYYNTYYTQFLIETEYLFPKKPDNYSLSTMQEIGEDITSYQDSSSEKVDIIAIQVESWHFLDNYDIEFNCDIFENYHRLAKEGMSGYMISPIYGGGTADIEYEALTGFTSNDTENITTPFNINMHTNFPGLIRTLKNNGYGTFSVHNYTNSLYNRKNAYPMLGFDESYFSDSFEDPDMSGPWITDRECVEKMIRIYEEQCNNYTNVMVYGLTMENHTPCGGRYTEDQLIGATSSSLSSDDLLTMRSYGTILKDIDSAIGYMADYLSTVDRKAILIVWGDHQTDAKETDNSDAVLTHTNFYSSYDETYDFFKLHSTPYLIWTNYDSLNSGKDAGYVVPNRVLAYALNSYDIIIPTYWRYFLNEETFYKGVTSNFLITNDNQIVFVKDEQQNKQYATRKLIQYDLIRGKRYLDNLID